MSRPKEQLLGRLFDSVFLSNCSKCGWFKPYECCVNTYLCTKIWTNIFSERQSQEDSKRQYSLGRFYGILVQRIDLSMAAMKCIEVWIPKGSFGAKHRAHGSTVCVITNLTAYRTSTRGPSRAIQHCSILFYRWPFEELSVKGAMRVRAIEPQLGSCVHSIISWAMAEGEAQYLKMCYENVCKLSYTFGPTPSATLCLSDHTIKAVDVMPHLANGLAGRWHTGRQALVSRGHLNTSC